MNFNISISVDEKIIDWLGKEADKNFNSKISPAASFYLRKAMEQSDKTIVAENKYTLTICPKCGAEYSSKLNQCPNCAEIEILILKKEENDVETIYQKEQAEKKARLTALKERVDGAEKRVEMARAVARKTAPISDWQESMERQDLIDAEKEYEEIINQIYQLENEVRVD